MSCNLEEKQYLDLIKNIIENGFLEEGRNGNTLSTFGASLRFTLKDGKIPIMTTKKTAWKTCVKELLWFISGNTNTQLLQEKGVNIWDGNTSRDFLDSRNLNAYPEGMMGPSYGYQWRSFGAKYDCSTGKPFEERKEGIEKKEGIDQLQYIIDQLKDSKTRNSRRLIMTAWNPLQLDEMALPPCHILCQFHVHKNNQLSCSMYQRSNDECCGTPFNIASYSFLTHLLAKHCGLEAYEFVYFKGNCHIYEEHIESAKLQMNREPFPFPTLIIKQMRENINDYKIQDFEINNYQHHDQIYYKMIA
jgi:thymidylate synthase